MARKRYSPEQMITKLREAEVLLSQGQTIAQACKPIEVSDQTYYRWRREYGGQSNSNNNMITLTTFTDSNKQGAINQMSMNDDLREALNDTAGDLAQLIPNPRIGAIGSFIFWRS